jgi:uncharacterized protein
MRKHFLGMTHSSHEAIMQHPDYDAARQYVFERLERESDSRLSYHTLAHTRDDVLPAAERLATSEGIGVDDLLLLRTAVLYHDIGYTVGRVEHELIAVRIAALTLPTFGYQPAHISTIDALIMATRLPQAPQNLLEQIIGDADLDLLGREDFLDRNAELRQELQAFGDTTSDRDWFSEQLTFLTQHRYWTATATRLRNEQKARNITALTRRLAIYTASLS